MHNNLKASEENAAQAKTLPPVSLVSTRMTHPFVIPSPVDDRAGHVTVIRDEKWAGERVGGTEPPVGGWSKRLFDICVAAAAIVALAPLLALVALLVRLDSPGPSFFRQERGGFNGRPFRIWKFRTMSVMENRGIVQARPGDARITALGAFLRRSSWDELPQLFNVIAGDMSMIGPRPHALEHDVQFERVDHRYPQRQRARPGLTGLAQVSGCRGPTETEEKVRARTGHDVEYVRNWSWPREFRIISRTVAVLLWKRDPSAL